MRLFLLLRMGELYFLNIFLYDGKNPILRYTTTFETSTSSASVISDLESYHLYGKENIYILDHIVTKTLHEMRFISSSF